MIIKVFLETRLNFSHVILDVESNYNKNQKKGESGLKIASSSYIKMIGQKPLFLEGNLRTASIIANWINLDEYFPPFILNNENAIDYFNSSAKIKEFTNKSSVMGKFNIIKYQKSFDKFLRENLNRKYLSQI